MENPDEIVRLEIKTDPDVVANQADWCGLKPGFRVLDAGCGPGKTTSILSGMIRPGGKIVGVDYSEERIQYAQKLYVNEPDIEFRAHDLRDPLDHFGMFDLIWVRFVLEYNRKESARIVKNLTQCLKAGGSLCLMDLDHNCLNHYELPAIIEKTLFKLMALVENEFNFDPYAGRKLYAYLYDEGYEEIEMDLRAHHLFYGRIKDEDIFNWLKKAEVGSLLIKERSKGYPGGYGAFNKDFKKFLLDPRRFTYTPLILCKGRKPL